MAHWKIILFRRLPADVYHPPGRINTLVRVFPQCPHFPNRWVAHSRDDQIRNIAAFIMNWEETASAIQEVPTPSGPIAGTDITKTLPEGDPQNGEVLAQSFACTTCHIDAPTGPYWPASDTEPAIGERSETRTAQSDYTGQAGTAKEYLFEAIVNPGTYLVTGFADGVMPNNYGSTLTEQDLADIIAYLLALRVGIHYALHKTTPTSWTSGTVYLVGCFSISSGYFSTNFRRQRST